MPVLCGLLNFHPGISEVFRQKLWLLKLCKWLTRQALPGSGNLWLIGCAGGDDKQAAHSLKRAILEADSDICGIEVYSDYVCNHAACFGGGDGIKH